MARVDQILVTGGRGLLGSSLADLGVHAVGREALDITDEEAVGQALDRLRPRAVINAAAQARVDLAETEVERTWAVNARAPGVLARACRQRGVRLVHLSTDYVLDGPDEPGHMLRPGDPPRPRSEYARSKLAGEDAVLDEQAVVVRVQWLYHPVRPCFFSRALDTLEGGGALRLVVDQVGCPTPTDVLARALVDCACSEPVGLFHYACRGEASAWEWIAAAAELLGLPLRADPVTRDQLGGAPRPARSCLDSTGFHEAFGVAPPHWRQALEQTLRAHPRPGPQARGRPR